MLSISPREQHMVRDITSLTIPTAADPARPLRADARRNRARILEVAEAVFAEKGSSASTEEIAKKAGVSIGTVFRHFPTKEDLLQAIIHALVVRMFEEIEPLLTESDPAEAFFSFFTYMVEQAAAKKTVVELLADAGIDIEVAKPVHALRQVIEELLNRAKQAGAVRADAEPADVMALLISLCHGALRVAWEPALRDHVLQIVFDGLRG